jgi:hypothetical protein
MKQQASWDTRETVTLESLLMRPAPGQPWTPCIVLSRQERYFIALTLASSLLQLHATPWLATRWSKKDILFLRNGPDSIIVDQPYISPQPFSQSPTYHDTSKSISALGIMLLELCFGIALEDHEIRRGFLGADMRKERRGRILRMPLDGVCAIKREGRARMLRMRGGKKRCLMRL